MEHMLARREGKWTGSLFPLRWIVGSIDDLDALVPWSRHPSSLPSPTSLRKSRSVVKPSILKWEVSIPLEIDLFASRLTYQIPHFFSWRPDSLVKAVNTFQQDWSSLKGLANPPWCLISRVLSQVHRQQAQIVLIAPRPELVSGTSGDVMGLSQAGCSNSRSNSEAIRLPDEVDPSTSCLVCLWERFSNNRPSEEANKLLLQSWKAKSAQFYDSHFRKWTGWCAERGRNPVFGPTSDVANFLTELYSQSYQSSSLNAFRSTISSIHDQVDGVMIGKHFPGAQRSI